MIYCFDLDGVICDNCWGHYEMAVPFPERIEQVNKLWEQGNKIIIFTARGTVTGIQWREFTEKQLAEWGVKYHELIFGKPNADYYVDDRGINVKDWDK